MVLAPRLSTGKRKNTIPEASPRKSYTIMFNKNGCLLVGTQAQFRTLGEITIMRYLLFPLDAPYRKRNLKKNPALEDGSLINMKAPVQEYPDKDPDEQYEGEDSSFDEEFSVDEYIQDDDFNDYGNSYGGDDEEDRKEMPIAIQSSFFESLQNQLDLLALDDKSFLIGAAATVLLEVIISVNAIINFCPNDKCIPAAVATKIAAKDRKCKGKRYGGETTKGAPSRLHRFRQCRIRTGRCKRNGIPVPLIALRNFITVVQVNVPLFALGGSPSPALDDYADGVNTLSFFYLQTLMIALFLAHKSVKGVVNTRITYSFRDDEFTLLAYFRVDRPDKSLEKIGLGDKAAILWRLCRRLPLVSLRI
ncbi:hypothetical protein FQR65_LT17120 [Abscondita terminalis]|nr:hypothetical protein FQR65_LT17120 [Abscondita terminalis]